MQKTNEALALAFLTLWDFGLTLIILAQSTADIPASGLHSPDHNVSLCSFQLYSVMTQTRPQPGIYCGRREGVSSLLFVPSLFPAFTYSPGFSAAFPSLCHDTGPLNPARSLKSPVSSPVGSWAKPVCKCIFVEFRTRGTCLVAANVVQFLSNRIWKLKHTFFRNLW